MATYQLKVNGERREATVDRSTPLLWVLREELKLTATKYGCGMALCGACTVHLGGKATRTCVLPIAAVGGQEGAGAFALGRVTAGLIYDFKRRNALPLAAFGTHNDIRRP